MVFQDTINLAPQEQGATDITDLISSIIKDSKIKVGTCQLFVHNSKSSLLINDTANESTKSQTADFLAQLAPSSDDSTGIIDNSMAAIPETMRAAITQTTVAFPVKNGRPLLGTWQGIYLMGKNITSERTQADHHDYWRINHPAASSGECNPKRYKQIPSRPIY